MDLRPYQVEAINALREGYRSGLKSQVLVFPTGGGKTPTATQVIQSVVSKGKRAIFLAHRKELIDQASKKLDAFGVPHGVVAGAHKRWEPYAPVQVASVQTLNARKTLPQADLVVIDECHRSPSASYRSILERYPNALVLGLTATPVRTDGRGLGDLFERLVIGATPRGLLEAGYLVPATGYVYDTPDLSRVKKVAGDYQQNELAQVMGARKLVGKVVEQWLQHARGKRTVVFAVNVEHSQTLARQFREAGVAAEHVDGTTATGEREAILKRLESGQTQVVCNCALFVEGWDMPALEVCVLARPTQSVSLYLQAVGRVLRPAPGKTVARIHDHAGCVLTHGLPYMDREWSLTQEGRRKGAVEAIPSLRTCEECFAVWAPSQGPETCPVCGHANQRSVRKPPTEVDGAAVALEALSVSAGNPLPLRQQIQAIQQASEQHKSVYFAYLSAAVRKGRSLGSAYYAFKNRFNQEPPRAWKVEWEQRQAAKQAELTEGVPA